MTLAPSGDEAAGREPANLPLDGLLRRHARAQPNAVALSWRTASGAPRELTFTQIDRAVDRVAGQLRDLEIGRRSVVAIQIANTPESLIALLGVLRGNFVAALVPLLWDFADASPALANAGARAIIAAPAGFRESHTVALRIAAKTFGIRFVLGFGDFVADGIVPLGAIEDVAGVLTAPLEDVCDARDPALITFDTDVIGHHARYRDHSSLLAGGEALARAAGLQPHCTIATTMLWSSFAALSASVTAWLLRGGRLVLHQPLDSEAQRHLTDDKPELLVLPGPLVGPLHACGLIGSHADATVAAIWRSDHQRNSAGTWHGPSTLLDILSLGEAGFVVLPRGRDGRPAALCLGQAAGAGVSPEALVELSRTEGGTLALWGAMLPRDFSESGEHPGPQNFDTALPCRIASDGTLLVAGFAHDIVEIGGYRFSLEQLRNTLARAAPHATLAAIPDLLTGQRIAGSGADAGPIGKALSDQGVSPLIIAAFCHQLS